MRSAFQAFCAKIPPIDFPCGLQCLKPYQAARRRRQIQFEPIFPDLAAVSAREAISIRMIAMRAATATNLRAMVSNWKTSFLAIF
jgi:hypothetical protein